MDPGMFQQTIDGAAVDFGAVFVTDPRLEKNFGFLPGAEKNYMSAQQSMPWAWGHETARNFRKGDHNAVYTHLHDMMGPINAQWNALDSTRARLAFGKPLTQCAAAALRAAMH